MTLKSRSDDVGLDGLSAIAFADIKPGLSTDIAVIQGRVSTAWPVNNLKKGRLLKVAIKEQNGSDEIIVFVFDENSEYDISVGDLLKLSNIWIEKATLASSKHPYQILVDEQQSKAVLQVEKRQLSGSASSSKENTSSRSDPVKNTATKKPLSKTSASVRKYIYSKLKDVKKNDCVDVYGVVKFFKSPTKSRGTDYMMIVSLTDPSFTDHFEKLTCVLFAKDMDRLPAIKNVGDIVRFHRLMISEFNSQPQGKNGAGFSWLVFDGTVGSSLEPRASSGPYFTLNEQDRENVTALREWKFEDAPLSQEVAHKVNTLSSVVCNQYMDLVCQVILTCELSPTSVLLRVWDATKISMPVVEEQTDGLPCKVDKDLDRRTRGYMYDVKVFDDHCPRALKVQPGDFVKLRNLHAARYKSSDIGQDYNVLPTIEFCLHRGTSYNRGLSILPLDSEEVRQLQLVLNEASVTPEPASVDSVVSVQSVEIDDLPGDGQGQMKDTEDKEGSTNKSSDSVDMFDLEEADERADASEPSVLQPQSANCCKEMLQSQLEVSVSDRRCMQTSATILTEDYHHLRTSSVQDVLQGRVPYKYKLRVKVKDFQPRPHKVEDFLRLYCPVCYYLNSVSGMRKIQPARIHDSVKYFHCPNCVQQSQDDSQACPVELEYIYLLQLLVLDNSHSILVQLWKEQAVKFFNNTEALSLLKDSETFCQIRKCLHKLVNCDSGQRHFTAVKDRDILESDNWPYVECCVMAYSTELGVCYQMFDSQLCMEESGSQLV